MNRILASAAAIALLVGPATAFAQAAAPAAPMAPMAMPAAPAPAAVAIPTIQPAGDLVATLKAAGQYNTLVKLLDASGLTPVLGGAGPLTVIAPTDSAFAALPAGTLDNLMKPENAAQLQGMLTPLIINAAVTLDKIQGSTPVSIPNVANGKVQFDATTPAIKINGASVVAAGTASNGDIYAIDKAPSA
jgi:uncharacterized surface protein with fasciclin (FAS1) repeats